MPPPAERPALVVASLAALAADLVATGAFLFHALRVRGRLERLAAGLLPSEVPPAADAYLSTPVPVFAAAFLLVVVGLLVKEVAVERKSVTLRLNLAYLAVAALLFAGFLHFVQGALEQVRLR